VSESLRARILELERQLADSTAPLHAKIADLERQLAEAFARPRVANSGAGNTGSMEAVTAPLKQRIVDLETQLDNVAAPLVARNADLERQLAEAFARPRVVSSGTDNVPVDVSAPLKARILELEGQLSDALARIAELEAQRASYMSGIAPDRTMGPADASNQTVRAIPPVPAHDSSDEGKVLVYGRTGDKDTEDVCKQLRGAQIPFERRDFDKDDGYKAPMAESGFRGGQVKPPVICLGQKAWWNDGSADDDAMFSIPWPATVAMEIRQRLGALGGAPSVPAPVRLDADIETELYERFTSMQQAFLSIDDNQDGKITESELLRKCRNWNIPLTEAERAIAEADSDRNGVLDFNEFAKRFNSNRPTGRALKVAAKPQKR